MATEAKGDDAEFKAWFEELYDITKINRDEFIGWYDEYQYKGFDRLQVLKDLKSKVKDVKIVQQIILVCGLLGPQRAALVKIIGHGTIESMGIPASGKKGSKGVSCQRITAATADLCAFFLKKTNVPKRLPLPCPGWLQFPSAGSIIMPAELREMHIDFARRFSTVIGGVFNEQIYQQMMNNAYLNQSLNLFDGVVIEPTIGIAPPPAPTFNPVRGDVGRTKTTATSVSSSASSSVPRRT
jgi:hypothetical protein